MKANTTMAIVQWTASLAAVVIVAGPWTWSGPSPALIASAAGFASAVAAWWLMPTVETITWVVLGIRLHAVQLWFVWLVRHGSGWRRVVRPESGIDIVAIPDGPSITERDIASLGWSTLTGWFTATAAGCVVILAGASGGADDRLLDRWLLATGALLLLFQTSRGIRTHETRPVPIWTAVRLSHFRPSRRAEIATSLRWQLTTPLIRPRDWPVWLVEEIEATVAGAFDEDPTGRARRLSAGFLSLQRALDDGDTAVGLKLARSLTGPEVEGDAQASAWPFVLVARALLEACVGAGLTEARAQLARVPAGSTARSWTPAVLVDAERMMRSGSAREAAALLTRERAGILRELEIWPGFDWLLERCDEALDRATELAEEQPPPAILPASVFGITSVEDATTTFAYGLVERSEWRFRTPYPGASS